VRVVALDQNEQRQLEDKVLGRMFTGKVPGWDTSRPQLTELVRFVETGTPS
jgi:hypothetical protein